MAAKDKKDGWDIGVSLATIVSLLAVPVGIAYFGNKIQESIAERQTQREYVQLAVSILSTRPISKDDPLRPWAIQIIDQNAPVKLSAEQRRGLLVGMYVYRPDPSIASRDYAPAIWPPEGKTAAPEDLRLDKRPAAELPKK